MIHIEQYQDLQHICDRFIKKEIDIEELSQRLAYVAVPYEWSNFVQNAENQIEQIRFCVDQCDQYGEGLKVVEEIIHRIRTLPTT